MSCSVRIAGHARSLATTALLIVGSLGPARADEVRALPTLHLAYEIAGHREACPDEPAFRRSVALRLGYDPFVPEGRPAARRLSVTVTETAPRSVTVTLLDDAGKVLGRRVINEPPPDCGELVANAAFAASVAIDPSVLTRPAPPAEIPAPGTSAPVEPPAEAAARRAPAEPHTEAPPAPARAAIVPSLRVGAATSFGVSPGAALGFVLGGSVRSGAVSAGLEGRLDLPTESERSLAGAPDRSVTVRTSLLVGGAHVCGHFGAARVVPYVCAVVFAGALRGASSGIASAKEDVSAYVAAGPRLGAALALSEHITIDLRIDVPFALAAVELRVDDRAVWTSPAVAAVAGVGASFVLP